MTKSKDEIMAIVLNDLLSIHNRSVEMTNRLQQNVDDSLDYIQELATQLSQPSSGPFVMKTPKMLRKRAAVPRIETIPENEVFERGHSQSTTSLQSVDMEEQETSILSGRSKRTASKKAADNIKKQAFQDDNTPTKKAKRQNSIKRKKSGASSSDEDDIRSSSKYSKIDEDPGKPKRSKRLTKKKSEQVVQSATLKKIQETEDVNEENAVELSKLQCSDKLKLKNSQDGEINKVDDVIVAPNMDNIEESLYEDAIEKPTPLMNSTMKHSFEKKLNVTVVLERLPKQTKLNETMVIHKVENNAESKKRSTSSTRKALQDNIMQSNKEIMELNNYNELITEDESSPEIKRPKYHKMKKEMKSLSSDNEIPNTPMKTRLRGAPTQEKMNKATYKSSALFNAYANESVKKRVEAFEQVAMNSPKSVDVDTPSRITRSKTRAMNTMTENVTQMLARKSLAKAKKISLAKQIKDTEEFKENKDTTRMPERITKLLDKPSTKQMQQKTTPLNKLRMVQPPTSMNRLQTPTSTQNILNCPKVLSAQRTNILTGIDSFITKSVSKTNSTNSEKTEDKKRHEDDARKKRDETLRLLTEEKRRKRQEKELKNKLAREAKERQELEKRQKLEREREEKAKLALLMQEKQREEMERKRLAQMQRTQEKEERRKLEEQQRLQKLQEQEEMERLLAEQRRREQEAERRREAEVRAQQQAATEALKQKLMLAAQAKSKPQGPTDYKLESEPDDDSDDESRPKHEIPYWAQPHNRKVKLAMQRHFPQGLINKFFNSRKCTPDLTELFQGIDRSRLKRTSSAIWKMPPRTDMMEVESLSNHN